MSTIGANVLTLADWAKRLDPDGKTPKIVELLSQSNEVLSDMLFMEGNLPTGHRTTVRTALPSVAWRLLNQGVQPSKSTTAQIDEACAMLEAWSEVDVELCNLNGNSAAFRLSEAQAFIEAMNQEMASTLFYGNSGTSPEEFMGLAPRYASSSAANGQNVILGGAAGGQTDCMSIYLVCWGANSIHGIFPKGSKAGLDHKDHGEVTVETTAGIAGTRMRAYQDQWTWKTGIALRDWRYVVRIANIDKSADNADYIDLMTKAYHRIPSLSMGKCAFYMNRTVRQRLDLLKRADVISGGGLTYDNADGKPVANFRGIPIRVCDALLESETAIS
jgi:hypothetical protein